MEMEIKINLAIAKWKWILLVLSANSLLVTGTVFLMSRLGYVSLGDYRLYHSHYFLPLSQFRFFFYNEVLETGIWEEIVYRWPVWFLINFGLVLSLKKYRLDSIFVWLAVIFSSYHWAIVHTPATLPIFITGLSLGWLIVKTKSLWPSMVAHCASNLLIYLALKTAAIFIKF